MLKNIMSIAIPEKLNASKILSGYKEVSTYLGVSTRTLHRYIKAIPISRLGRRIIIAESELVEWIKEIRKIS